MWPALRKLARRLDSWLHRDEREGELREEIEAHRRALGAAPVTSPALAIEQASSQWIPLATVARDMRFGWRQLGHNRLFTLVSLFGLTLAIGLSPPVFPVLVPSTCALCPSRMESGPCACGGWAATAA